MINEGTAEHEAEIQKRFLSMESRLAQLSSLNERLTTAIADWVDERRSTDRVAVEVTQLSRDLTAAHKLVLDGLDDLRYLRREAGPAAHQLASVIDQADSASMSLESASRAMSDGISEQLTRVSEVAAKFERQVEQMSNLESQLTWRLTQTLSDSEARIAQSVRDANTPLLHEMSRLRTELSGMNKTRPTRQTHDQRDKRAQSMGIPTIKSFEDVEVALITLVAMMICAILTLVLPTALVVVVIISASLVAPKIVSSLRSLL